MALLLLYLGEDGRGVAETILTSLSHQSTIRDLKVKFNYNFLSLHLGGNGEGVRQ